MHFEVFFVSQPANTEKLFNYLFCLIQQYLALLWHRELRKSLSVSKKYSDIRMRFLITIAHLCKICVASCVRVRFIFHLVFWHINLVNAFFCLKTFCLIVKKMLRWLLILYPTTNTIFSTIQFLHNRALWSP